MIDLCILAAIRGEFGSRDLPAVGTPYDEIYTVVRCPVCGNKTLDQHDICVHCGWEYDGCDVEHFSVCNMSCLNEYRRTYRELRSRLESL